MKHTLIISIFLFTTTSFSQRGRIQLGFLDCTTKNFTSVDFNVKYSIRYYLIDNLLVSFSGYGEKSVLLFRYYAFSTAGSFISIGKVINTSIDDAVLFQIGYSKNLWNIWVEPFISTEFYNFRSLKNSKLNFGASIGISIN